MKKLLFISLILTVCCFSSFGQTKNKTKMKKETTSVNPLICDVEEGICGVPDNSDKTSQIVSTDQKRLKVVYFTDPICSSCWGIEPQLRKLKLEYGNELTIEYRMGGLLKDWTYNSGGISKPSDVAHHWDEVSGHYDMPIDGDVWLEDPLDSSYPPSIAFKAAELQDHDKALLFLREMREMVFLKKINIAKWENMAVAAQKVGLNVEQLKTDFNGKAKTLFEEDLKIAKDAGVRGFPTMIFVNREGVSEIVYGSKPYPFYETAILKLHPKAIKGEYKKDWKSLFLKYKSLTAKEYSVLSDTPRSESAITLDALVTQGMLEKIKTKNGDMWLLK